MGEKLVRYYAITDINTAQHQLHRVSQTQLCFVRCIWCIEDCFTTEHAQQKMLYACYYKLLVCSVKIVNTIAAMAYTIQQHVCNKLMRNNLIGVQIQDISGCSVMSNFIISLVSTAPLEKTCKPYSRGNQHCAHGHLVTHREPRLGMF